MVCLVFYLFFDDLDLALESVHSLNDAVVFFNTHRKLIDLLLDERDLSIDLSTGARHCCYVRNHRGDYGGRGCDDSDYNLFCNHCEITPVTL